MNEGNELLMLRFLNFRLLAVKFALNFLITDKHNNWGIKKVSADDSTITNTSNLRRMETCSVSISIPWLELGEITGKFVL